MNHPPKKETSLTDPKKELNKLLKEKMAQNAALEKILSGLDKKFGKTTDINKP